MIILKTLRPHLFLLLAMAALQPAHAELAIIANPQNPMMGIGKDELRDIYRGGRTSVSGVGTLEAVDQGVGMVARDKFNSDVLLMNESQLKSYWSRRMFTGKGKPPAVAGDDVAVREWVARNPSAIGYVDGSQLDSSVKVLLILP